MIIAVAQFERDLLIERTQSGLAMAKSKGKALGRSNLLSSSQQQQVLEQIQQGKTISAIAKYFNISRQSIIRIRNKVV